MRLGLTTQMWAVDSGEVEWGHEVQVGYFAQDHRGTIPRRDDRGGVAALS